MSPEQRSEEPAGVRTAELVAENERLGAELERATAARDALVREALGGALAQRNTSRRRLMLPLLLAFLLLAALLIWQLLHTTATVTGRRQPASSAARGAAQEPAPSPAPKSAAAPAGLVPGARQQIAYPVREVSVLGRAALGAGGALAAAAGWDGRVVCVDLARSKVKWIARAHQSATRDVIFARADHLVLNGGADGGVHVWDAATGDRVRTLRRSGPPVRRLAAQGERVAVAAEVGTVELFDLRSGRRTHELSAHEGWVRAVAFAPSGALLATAGHDGVIRLWSLPAGKRVRELPGHDFWISALAFDPSGERLASGSFDKRVRVWQVSTGQRLAELRGHVRWITDLGFGPQGELLASASVDRTAMLWDTATWTSRHALEGHGYQVSSVHLDPRRRFVLSASTDGFLRLWPLPPVSPRVLAPLPPPGPGELTLRNSSSGERVRVRVMGPDGNVLEAGRRQLAHILRSAPDDLTHPPAPELVQLLYKVADHFGRAHEIEVISGYRSPQYNSLRVRQSREVGKKSKHRLGTAIDFRIRGITITALRDYVQGLGAGGVGFYADSQFVHMDVGPVRTWGGD